MSDDDDQLEEAEDVEHKKWLVKIPGGDVEKEEPKCEECEKLKFLSEELKAQLESEKRAMDEAICMVEKLERDHKSALAEQKMLLSFEKDKVIMLEKSLEAERKARMEEIYKQDRQSKDFKFVERDLERTNVTNMAMADEFEAVKKENVALAEAARLLQENKDSILVELQRYEVQLAELEAHNTDLRKRLYSSEADREMFQTQCGRLQAKLERHLAGSGASSHFTKSNGMSNKHKLGPLRSRTSASRWPIEQSQQLSQPSKLSMKSPSRISDLSTVNVIKKFNSDPRTVRYNQQRMPGLWPTAM